MRDGFKISSLGWPCNTLPFVVFGAIFFHSTAYAQTDLTILHTKEHHPAAQSTEQDGIERDAARIRKIRMETDRVLVIDGGNRFKRRGDSAVTAMNQIGYDVLALGKDDFGLGIGPLKTLQKEADFPFLCTNVRPRESGVCVRHAITTIGKVRIGMLGLIGKGAAFSGAAAKDLDVQDPIAAARQAADELREGVEVLVAITHQDRDDDIALAKAIPALDVIIGMQSDGFEGLLRPGESAPLEGRVELTGVGPIYTNAKARGKTRILGRLDLLIHDRTIMVAEAHTLELD